MATAKEAPGGANPNNTVIGQSILINGKLTGDEDLTVQGRVEGELTLTRTLIVEPSGVVKANVAVKNAIISGVVVGNINATESVELTREGRMVGDIHAPRVIIVDGASFRGRVDMGEVEPGRINNEQRAARPVVRTPPPRPTLSTPSRPPPPPARPELPKSKPLPPPPPAVTKVESSKASSDTKVESKPPPPAPPVIAAGSKKKVLLKKKAR